MTAFFIPASQGWEVPAPASVLSRGSAGRAEEEAGGEQACEAEGVPTKTEPALPNWGFSTWPGEGQGSAVLLLFTALSGPVWFCWHWFFCAVARSAASGFLFLDASVGASSFYSKQRKPVGILKLGGFSTKSRCIFFRGWWEVSIGW